jgi:hypothetical protein
VSLEKKEAIVTYESPATTQAMIDAVAAATPVGPAAYQARVKPPGASS